jgi:alpha-tubulin suppressor-like RCC1 family protein
MLSGVRAIAAGGYHSLALTSNGTVTAWGAGGAGQGVDPHFGQSEAPTNLSGIVVVAGGAKSQLGDQSRRKRRGVGDKTYGQCTVPAGLGGALAIAGETYYSAALKLDGTVLTWGHSPFGYAFSPPWGLGGVVAISATEGYTLAVVEEFLEVQSMPSI